MWRMLRARKPPGRARTVSSNACGMTPSRSRFGTKVSTPPLRFRASAASRLISTDETRWSPAWSIRLLTSIPLTPFGYGTPAPRTHQLG
jgi:hypothetical protein